MKSMQVKVTRSDMQHFTLFDGPLYQQMLKHIPSDQHSRLNLVHCLGNASDAKIASFYATLSPACQHCGDPDGSIVHKCWSCPTLKHVRLADAERLREVVIKACPSYLLLGIPGDFAAIPDYNYCHPLCVEDGTSNDNIGITYDQDWQLARGAFACKNFDLLHGHGYTAATYYLLPHADLPHELRADRCADGAPIQPNGWTDGSWTFPDSCFSPLRPLVCGVPAPPIPPPRPSLPSAGPSTCHLVCLVASGWLVS